MQLKDTRIITAIVTPFNEENEINFQALEVLTNHLIEHGSDGFVIGGTTGEGATLSDDEKVELYQRFADIVDNRAYIIANVGTNNTSATIEFAKKVDQIKGINALLVVVPYYNKPTQKGIIAHFKTIADNVNLPIMIYNIPGRTAVEASATTILELARYKNILGVKQCAKLEELSLIIEKKPDDFVVFTGEDNQALAARVLGANGVISVASHLYGDELTNLYNALDSGNIRKAGEIQRYLNPKIDTLFSYSSPTPVKVALNKLGFNTGSVRLPLVELNEKESSQILIALGDEN